MRSILFDVDGVLVHGINARADKSVKWSRNLEKDFGVREEDFRKYFIKRSFESEVLPGKRDLHDALSDILPDIGYGGDVQAFIDYWLENDTNVDDALLGEIAKLSRDTSVRLYVATNQEHYRASYLWNQLGFQHHFRDMFYAARVGAIKPDVRFFEYIENTLDFGDQPPLFFDDDPRVIKVANALGWEAVHYTHIRDFCEHEMIREKLGCTTGRSHQAC